MLFVSGEKPDRFAKALAAGADLVCIDLEDAVHPAHKSEARREALAFAAQRGRSQEAARLALRLNGLRTREGLADVMALIESGAVLDCLVLPKVEHAQDLSLIHCWAPDSFRSLVALVETPLGVENAAAMAAAARNGAPKLAALMLGGADLSVELGAAFDWDGLLSARGRLVNAARSAGLQAWDVPHLDLDDLPALAAETRAVRRLGFTCKAAIHPRQISTIHSAFEPDPAEVVWARALLDANATRESTAMAAGAFLFQGKMVDAPVLMKARRIVQIADDATKAGDPPALNA
ncbi:HpcH/HpaI aldolase/citrate lyase family protein [Caenimonas soli]|uniref:HpcH/HpaI aldolase/citrate lyase family protein n=1 Tax=Caenimonas soli TaxID=2735555 RepID=UPI001F46D062|nr:CoA ester lyase [Caenimonas soli]